jgi:hypothetical protein
MDVGKVPANTTTHTPRVLRRPRSATTRNATANEKRQQNIVGNTTEKLGSGTFVTPTAFEFQRGVLTTSPGGQRKQATYGSPHARSRKKDQFSSGGGSPPQQASGRTPSHVPHIRSDLSNLHNLIQYQRDQSGKNKFESERLAMTIGALAQAAPAPTREKQRRPQSAPHKRHQHNHHDKQNRPPSAGKSRTPDPGTQRDIYSHESSIGGGEGVPMGFEINIVRPAMKQLRALLHSGRDVGPILAYLSGSGCELPDNSHQSVSKTRARNVSDLFKKRIRELAVNSEQNGYGGGLVERKDSTLGRIER